MSKSFKKVVACLLAVLMVMFSVPFTALADGPDTTVYTPDVRLQFGTLFQADGTNEDGDPRETWVDNYANGYVVNATGKNGATDFGLSGVAGPQLVATGSVSNDAKYTVNGLKIEAADTANAILSSSYVDNEYEFEALSDDYSLKKGDAFTVTVRMDGVPSVYVATAEIAFSNNIEPLYTCDNGLTGKSRQVLTGTAAQLSDYVDPTDDESFDMGTKGVEDFDAQAYYTGINSGEIGSVILKDYDGQNYMYAEAIANPAKAWNKTTKGQALDETGLETNMQGKSIICTFAFVLKDNISAENPIQFWVHNGNTKSHGKNVKTGSDMFTGYSEGGYAPIADNEAAYNYTTYGENRFVAGDPWGATEENFGSRKMTFMGKNENVAAPEPTHVHDFTGAEPVWVWAEDNTSATATITCTADGCDQSEGYQISETDSEIDSVVKTEANCTTKGVNTLTATVSLNGSEVSTSKDVEGAIDADNHNYVGAYTEPTCTANGFTTYTCSRCQDSYVEYDNPSTQLSHNFNTPVSIAWDGDDKVTATVTLKCATCDETTTTDATVNSVEKTAATCEADQVITYTASYDGIESISKDVTVADTATGHAYAVASVDWNTLNTETGAVTAHYVCAYDSNHTKDETVTASAQVIQQQTEDQGEITRFSYTEGTFSDSTDVQTKNPAGHTTHTYTVPVSLEWVGDTTTAKATFKCSKCDATTQYDATVNSQQKSAATCTAAEVVTYTASYDGFDSISKDVTVGQPLNHDFTVPVSLAWDGDDATTATATFKCSRCTETTTAVADVQRVEKAKATKTTPAVYTYTASYDGFDSISKDVEEGEALGVNITIPKYDIGMVTVNGEEVDGTKDNTINVAYGQSVTFAVTDGKDYFGGWEINNKVIDNAAEYTYEAATFDMTVTPVFVEPTANTMTVVFLDKFGNKVKDYTNISVDDYAAAIAADGIPVATSFPSSKFIGWDMDDAAIAALTTSATILAQYEDVESENKFTVTVQDAQGADITATTLNADALAINGQIPYDTKVTVTDSAAEGWAIDGTTVATGKSYSFFVGADVTITRLDAAEEFPATAIVGATLLDVTNNAGQKYRYNIMATRFVPAGWTLVDYGFVYGKNLTDADLNLDNEGKTGNGVNSGAVKVAHGSMTNTSSEFALNYGIKNADATVTAKSFVVAKKGTDIKVVYSDMFSRGYNNN